MRRVTAGLVGVLLVGIVAGCSQDGSGVAGSEDGRATTEPSDGIGEPLGRHDTYLPRFPAFPDLEVTGEGSEVIELPVGAWAGTVTATFPGADHVGLWAVDATGTPTSTLVNTTGPYEGTTAFGVTGLEDTTGLSIQANGQWTLTIRSVQDAPIMSFPASSEGDGVYWIMDAPMEATVTFPADGHFTMTTFREYAYPELNINFIPLIDVGEVIPGSRHEWPLELERGAELTIITTTGPWQIDKRP